MPQTQVVTNLGQIYTCGQHQPQPQPQPQPQRQSRPPPAAAPPSAAAITLVLVRGGRPPPPSRRRRRRPAASGRVRAALWLSYPAIGGLAIRIAGGHDAEGLTPAKLHSNAFIYPGSLNGSKPEGPPPFSASGCPNGSSLEAWQAAGFDVSSRQQQVGATANTLISMMRRWLPLLS